MSLLDNILVPTDFSPNSQSALNYACDLANSSGAKLHLVYVVPDQELDESERIRLMQRVGQVLDARSELSIVTTKAILTGLPAIAIEQYARENKIDVIVMGTHGRTGLAHLALGSVTEAVLRKSPCPVLVLGPHDGENSSVSDAAALLEKIVGDGFPSEKESGRQALVETLQNRLRVPSTTAMLMFDELEQKKWLLWEGGRWACVEGAELVEEARPDYIALTLESQAVDLIQRAKKLRATDVHIDPIDPKSDVIRMRIDGQLRTYCRTERAVTLHLVNQLRTMAKLSIAEPFKVQESRVRLPIDLDGLEVRITTAPVAGGQAVALRLFDPENVFLPLGHLGLSTSALESIETMLRLGDGMVLITGPTGSGKTTTVYSMLETIGGEDKVVVSIEDPVEFSAPFVRQINVDAQHGLTMTEGLKTMLRMDPDIVFLGEIRDPETAHIGMRSASSGKYVFSTMHTRDIASTLIAIRDLGLDSRSVAANLTGVINQRLVRTLCRQCRSETRVTDRQMVEFEQCQVTAPEHLFEPVGCPTCNGAGYFGRMGIFEIANIDDHLGQIISEQPTRHQLEISLREHNVTSLRADALQKAAHGLISYADAIGIHWLS